MKNDKIKKIKINLAKPDKKEVDLVVLALKRGETAVLPTETIYGLHCDARNGRAVNKIYQIKKREKEKSFIILVSDLAMLKKICFFKPDQEEIIKDLWFNKKRPTTLVLKERGVLPKNLNEGKDTLAVRLPKSEFLIKIIKKLKSPIVSTSLNLAGKKNLVNLDDLETYFEKLPDLAVDAGRLPKRQPSKIVDVTDLEKIKVLRK